MYIDSYIRHHGVKGQKWGVIRKRAKDSYSKHQKSVKVAERVAINGVVKPIAKTAVTPILQTVGQLAVDAIGASTLMNLALSASNPALAAGLGILAAFPVANGANKAIDFFDGDKDYTKFAETKDARYGETQKKKDIRYE